MPKVFRDVVAEVISVSCAGGACITVKAVGGCAIEGFSMAHIFNGESRNLTSPSTPLTEGQHVVLKNVRSQESGLPIVTEFEVFEDSAGAQAAE